MKQSTFSAVMANSIKNLLQGYTKGIRFVAVLTMLLTMGIGQAWGETWEKVTSAPSDWSGDYLIVYEDGKVAFDGSRTTLDAASNTFSVTISNGKITTASTTGDTKYFTIAKSGTSYTIKSKSGYYIGQTSNVNGLKSSTSTTYSHTISLNNDKTVNLVSGSAYLRYNSASDQKRFRYYKSSSYTNQKAIQLYKKVAATPTLTVSKTSLSISTKVGASKTGTFTFSGSNLTSNATLTISGTHAGYFKVNPTSKTLSSGSIATTTATVTYSPEEYGTHTATLTVKSGTASKTVTLNGTATCSYNINYTTNNEPDGDADAIWSKDNCFEQVGSTTEWRYEMTLPGGGGSFWVGNGAWVDNKSEVHSLSSITFVGLQGTSCGTKPYPGEGAVGYVRIYSDSGSKNYYAAFQPTYQIAFGIEDQTWQHKPFALVSGNQYETELIELPTDFSNTYKYYVGPKNSDNTTNWVNGKSSTDAVNTMGGMSSPADLKSAKGKFRMYDNSCDNNWYCSFIPYYNYKLLNDDGSVFYTSDYVSSESSSKSTTIHTGIPTKTGYTFVGWSRTQNATTADVKGGDSYNYWKVNDTFYPVWKANYTVTFDLQGHGTAIDPQTVVAGSKATKPADPSATGYTFGGWYKESACNNVFDFNTVINANTTIYAKWTAKKYTYTLYPNTPAGATVIFKDKAGNSVDKIQIIQTYGETAQSFANFYSEISCEGYRFEGWYSATSGGSKWTQTQSKPADNGVFNFYAHWTKVHTITWKVNKQTYTTGSPTTSVDEGSTYKNLTLPTDPSDNTLDECYKGKKFVGWSTTNIGSTESDKPSILFKTAAEAPNTAITENTILYAVFATETPTTSKSSVTIAITGAASGTITDVLSWSSAQNEGTAKTAWNDAGHFRLYPNKNNGNGSSITITPKSGITIDEVVLTATSDTYAKPVKYNIDGGSDVSGTWNDTKMTISGINATSSFKFRNAHIGAENDQVRVTVSVTYLKEISSTETSNYVTECCTLNNITLDGSGTTTGGTFSATQEAQALTKACKGEVVTLTATAAECYEFVSWTIKKTSDDTDVTNSVLDGNTLTMPDYAVTIYATFKSLSVTEITLSMTGGHKNLDVGETNQILVAYTPTDATCDNAIDSWTSSDDNVMSVTSDGLVKALRAGNATITATTEGGVTATYTITVNNPACDSWYIHYWNNSTSGDECFYKVKPDDPNDHEWRTNNFSLPSFSDEDKFIVNNTPEDPYKTDQVFRTGIGFADIQRGGQDCGTNPYPGQDAYGQLSIYDDSETTNRYIAFYPAQYLVTYGKDGTAPWEVLPLNNTTGYEYETEPFMVPNGYKTDDTYKYYVGITDKNGNIKYVGYEFGGVEYKKSSVDPMNTVNGLSANDMAGKWGTWHIYSNSCANNWYCEFIHYYRVEFNLNGGEGDFAPRYGKATTPYVKFTTTDIGAPTRTGYTFLGWKDQNNKIYAPTGANVTINNDLTLTALWVEEYGSDNCRWEEVTIDDIVYGDEVVIATVNGDMTYALKDNDGGTTYAPKAALLTINSNKTINTEGAPISNALIWNIDYDKEGTKNLVIYSTKNAGKWLYSINNNNGIRIGTNSDKDFKIVAGTGDDAGNFFLYHIAQKRYLGVYYSNLEWRGYTTINTNNITGQTLKFYKKVCLPEGQYRVTWDANGGAWSDGSTTKEEVYAEGATINKPDKPKRDGYEFDSWEPTPSTMPAENITFTAKWAEFCTVTYTVGNGDTAPGEMQAVENTNITLPSLTTNLTCVKFVGWTDAVNDAAITSGNIYKAGDSYTVTDNITLKAVYAAGGGFVLVTDANDLAAGNRIVIAAAGFNVAMGADRGNNRGEVEVTKDNTDNTITTPDGIQILTLEAGTTTGTFAFSTGNGYLYAAGGTSSNYLKTTQALDSKGSWNISISAEGIATIKSVEPTGDKARNWLRYNSTSDPHIFSCYASGQADVSIYKESVTGYTTNPECVMYNVTLCTPTNGTISVDKTIVDPYGSTILTFMPASGYMLEAVSVTSGNAEVGTVSYTSNQTSGGTVKISNIQSDIEVCATFKAIPYYKVTFVDMNNGNAETVVHQSEFGGDITAPATASAGCDNVTWTFIGWAPSNSLNGTTEVPANLVEAGGTISGANITNNNLIYYSVYSNSSDGTPPFSIGKSGTYYFKAITEDDKVYYATGEMYSNKYRSNQETKIPFYVYYNTTTKKYTIKNTLTDRYVTPTYDNGWANALQEQATSFEWTILSYSNGDFTLYEETGSINSDAKTGEYLFTYLNKSGNTRAIYFGGTYFESSGLTYSDYALYLEPASEMHYYNASSCTELVTMSFDVPADAVLTYADGYPEGYYKDSEKKTITTFPTLEYAGWTFIGWTAGTPYNDVIGEDYLNDENSSADAPTQTIYKTGVEYPLTSDVTMYPVFTKFADNEPFDMVNGGDYYIYYIADGDVATSEDEYGATNRIYAGGWGSGGTSDSYGATQSCASATLFTFTKLSNGKWSIYDNTKGKYLCAGATDNNLALNTTTATYGEWTITVHNGNQVNAVSKDGYTLSAQSQDAVTGTFKNYATSNFNNNSAYYHRVYVGTCTERVYSSNPSNKPKITLNGTATVTSTKDQTIRSAKSLTLSAVKLAANGTITLTSDNADVYFSTDKTANFSKAIKPVASLTINADANGKLALTTVYVHYKPAAVPTSNLDIQTVTITATTGTDRQPNYATATTTATVRNLPIDFVIAAKWDGHWYALPANCTSSQSPTEGLLIEVDNIDNPQMAIAAPASAKFGLKSVYTSNSTADRYADNGESLVFVENVTEETPVANQTLYNGSDANIQVNAQYSNYTQTNSDKYEWIPTTSDFNEYTLTNASTGRNLGLTSGTFGAYTAASNQVRLLPATFYEPAPVQVLKWKANSVIVMYTGTETTATTQVGNNAKSAEQTLAKQQLTHGIYELTTNLALTSNAGGALKLNFGENTRVELEIPLIISGDVTASANAHDVVILENSKLIADATKYSYKDVYVYGGAKLAIPTGTALGVNNIILRAGAVATNGAGQEATYQYIYPQVELKGTLTSSVQNIRYEYVTDYDHWYHLVLPFDGSLASIHYPYEYYGDQVKLDNKGSWIIKRYDGATRATGNYDAWKDIEKDEPKATIVTAGKGYIFWGAPKKVTANGVYERPKWGIQRITMLSNVSETIAKATDAENTDKTISDLGSYENVANNSKKVNDQGWNLIGNPYMVDLTTMSEVGLKAGKLVEERVDDKWTGKWINNGDNLRYLTIPSEHFDTYEAKTVRDAISANALVPGRAFFVQLEGEADGVTFAADNRASLMPALRAANDKPVDIETGIVLSNETLQDEVNFWIKAGKTNDYEYNADYPKTPNNNQFNIYGVHTNGDLSWVATGPEYAAESMPIGYQVPAAGTYMLSLSEIYNSDGLDALYVTDHALSPEVTVNIMSEPYEFSVNQAETNNERFTVSVRVKAKTENGATGLGNVGADGEQIHKFIYQDKMYILHHGVIYDATGKRVITINK